MRPGAFFWRGLAAALAGAAAAPAIGRPADRIVPNLEALASHPATVLPPPPEWIAGPQTSVWTIEDIEAELKKVTVKPPPINHGLPTFVRPDHRWLTAFISWFRRLDKPLKIRPQDELWNCANYARCFVAFADLLAQKGGETRGSICVGWAVVFNRVSFGNIAAGEMHAIVIVGTSDGLFAIEPQNGTMIALRDYPNRDEFTELNF